MAHLLDGKDIENWFSAMHEPAKLGKGCREPAKKYYPRSLNQR